MKLRHTAPFSADYPTLGVHDVQPRGIVELTGEKAQQALKSGGFEKVPDHPKRTARPRPAADKTTPVPGTKEGE